MEDFKFVWKIENYNFLPSQRGKALKSPLFNVNLSISTFLELYPKGDILDPDKECIIICLKNCAKLPHTDVNCELVLVGRESSSREHFAKLPTGKAHDCAKWRFKRLEENSRFLSDKKLDEFAKATLIVTCYFSQKDSVVSKGSPSILNEKDIDLLSKDMEKIYISKEFNDLTLSTATESFPIHKAVLYARVPKLLNDIQCEADDNESSSKVVPDLDASALRILLQYVYSGKLDASTENIPSSLYKAADSYELIDLKQKLCSYPNEVTARTCVKVDQNEFVWPIPNTNKLGEDKRLYSPSFTGGIIPGSDLKLSCYLTNSNGKDSLEICIHRLFPNKDNPIFVKCKFSVNNVFRVAEHVFYSDEEWHFPSFIPVVRKNGILHNVYQESLTTELTLKCEFCVSGGETVYTEETCCSSAKYESFVLRGEDASNLCSDLGVLYNIFLPKVSDVVLTVGAVQFPAHKVVLAARSPVFARMFENDMLEKKSGIVNIKDIDIAILNMMLTYMYSAKVETLNYESAVKLYTAADRYEVIALKEHCSSFLKQDLSASNACDLLILADMHGDVDLKSYTQDFICAHADTILEMPEWNRLIDSRVELATEILRSLTIIVRAQNKGCATCEKTKMG